MNIVRVTLGHVSVTYVEPNSENTLTTTPVPFNLVRASFLSPEQLQINHALDIQRNRMETAFVLRRAMNETNYRRSLDLLKAQVQKIQESVSAQDPFCQQLIKDLEHRYPSERDYRLSQNAFVKLKTNNILQLPLNQTEKHITIDPNEFQNLDVTLICYKIHLRKKNEEVFAYLFKNVNPTGIWYDMNIRDGDRLVTLNGQNVTQLSYENIYSLIIEKKLPFTCEVVWHPELYIDLETCINKNIDNEQDYSIISQTSKISSDILKESSDHKTLIGINIYENLTHTLRHLFDYHPKEPYKLFKELSKKFYEKEQELSINNQEESYSFAQRQLNFLSDRSIIQGNPEETMTNILELGFLFEQIGIGLNKDEIY
ncbi:unnamed protein product, partial [Rotaria sp. Silwood2]